MKKRLKDNLTLKGHYRFTLKNKKTGKVRVFKYDNVITINAKNLIAKHFTDPTPTDSMTINYAALGTGTNTPLASDTQLQTETYRNEIASLSDSGNKAFATSHFTETETSGTFKEAGIFASASGTANSGVLISRVAIDITKTTSDTLTLDWELTID